MSKERVDTLLVSLGLAESRSRAQRLVMAGQVRADGQVVPKASTLISPDAELAVKSLPRFVSRGGDKLNAALSAFSLDVSDFHCADIGSSTGGFSDCLLQKGAIKVYAIDVGRGQLHWKLRKDPRVEVMEKTNARYLKMLPEPVDLVTIDVSFISLKVLLPVAKQWLQDNGKVVALIKPQFEAGRKLVTRGKGVIRDKEIHQQVLMDVLEFASDITFSVENLIRSPLLGPKGNVEFLTLLGTGSKSYLSLEPLISRVIGEENEPLKESGG